MLKYILMILGGVIFIAGYYFMQQNEGRGKTMMFYSLFTYAGLTKLLTAAFTFSIVCNISFPLFRRSLV